MKKDIKRMNYFNGQLLNDEDLKLEQNYHIRMHRMHNRYFHDWGIVTGLEVTPVQGYSRVTVSEGMALNRIIDEVTKDELSQEIFYLGDNLGNVLDLSGYNPGENIYITLGYEEKECDVDRLKGGHEVHIRENGRLNIRKAKSQDPKAESYDPKAMPVDSEGNQIDPKVEIVLARVVLPKNEADGLMVYETYADGETQLRTYAVSNGTRLEAEKLSIGPKDKPSLPYITGINDVNTGDGIDVHSPFTRFTGSIKSGPVSASGSVDVSGSLSVTASNNKGLKVNPDGSVDISGKAGIENALTVADSLTVGNGMSVSGESANIDTNHVVISSNMVTINKNPKGENELDNNETSEKDSSGLEVYRGGVKPNAKIVWDDGAEVWKIGTESVSKGETAGEQTAGEETDKTGLFEIAYGPLWEKMSKGSNADEMHKHGQLWSKDGIPVLNVDNTGGISVEKALTVFGNLLLKNGKLVVPRGGIEPDATIVWNEEKDCWQVVIGDKAENIAYGSKWEELIGGASADDLHTHKEFYSDDKSLAISINQAGNVDVPHNLSVGESLTVKGDLKVEGTTTTVTKVNSQISDNTFLLNNYTEGTPPENPDENESGIEVFRGSAKPRARMIWSESLKKWRVGVGDDLEDIASGTKWNNLTESKTADDLHSHTKLVTTNGDTALTANPQGSVETSGDMNVKGGLVVDNNVQVKGLMELDGSITVNGDLTVKGTQTTVNSKSLEVDDNVIIVNRYKDNSIPLKNEGGLEVFRGGTISNARIVWSETDSKWKVGTGDNMVDLPYGTKWDALTGGQTSDSLHKHSSLVDSDGNNALNIDEDGNIQMDGDAKVQGALTVDGKVTVEGDLVVKGVVVKKSDMQISDNMILLNHYEGDDPQPLVESGLEVYRGDDDKARIVWDEKSGKWKMGTGNQLEDIAGGSKWDTLIGEGNADALHMHSQVYNENGDILALSASAAGNVDIPHILTVGNNMIVIGNLDVKGKVTSINTEKLEIRDNIITVNRYQHEGASQSDGGIEVYRGEDTPAASIIWDETNDLWKMGNSAENPALKVDSNGNITATGKLHSAGANIEGTLQVKNGMEILRYPEQKAQVAWNEETRQWSMGVENNACLEVSEGGKVTVGAELDVKENAAVKGKLTAESITAGLAQFTGITLKGSQRSLIVSENGLEVSRKDTAGKDLPGAQIVWDEKSGKWKFGIGQELQDIKNNTCLYTPDGKQQALSVDENGNTSIKGILAVTDHMEVIPDNGEKGLLSWDGEACRWKAGPADNLKEISLSDHTHSNVCLPNGTPAITVDTSGNATVSNNLTVKGELMVTGKTVTVKAETLEVRDNIIRINKYENLNEPLAINSGISVFRGDNNAEAQIIWNEKDLKWQAGTTTDGLKDIGFREHYHNFICRENSEAPALTVDSIGNVGIGKSADIGYNVDIKGIVRADNLSQASSGSFVENRNNLEFNMALELLNGLNPVSFDYKEDGPKKHNIGFITEEVPEVFATTDKKSVTLMDIIGVLTAVVKKQQQDGEDMKEQLTALQGNITTLTTSLAALDGKVTTTNTSLTALQGKVTSIDTTLNTLQGKVTTMDTAVKALQSGAATTNITLTALQGDVTAIDTTLDTLQGKVTTIDTAVKALQSGAATTTTTLTTLQGNITTMDTAVKALQSGAATTTTTLTTLQGNITTVDTAVKALQSGAATTNTSLTDLQDDVTAIDTALDTLQSKVTEMDTALENLDGDVTTTNTSLTTLQGNITTSLSTLQDQVDELRVDVDALKA